MQTGEVVFRSSENTKDVTSQTSITVDGQHLVGIYEENSNDDSGSCYISIRLNDVQRYGELFIFDSYDHIVYINDFVCKGVIVKGKGKKLLFDVLSYIRSIKGKKTYVTLLAASKERVVNGVLKRSNDEKLMTYYKRLGFQKIDEIDGLMYGNIETIMMACSPENFKSLPDPDPPMRLAAAAAAAASAAPVDRKEPDPAYFSDSTVAPLDSEFEYDSDTSHDGGKNRKYKTKTRKYRTKTRKNKKSKKRWSLKYKKSINCKRPRGFSQRQYCKYGRKKSYKK